MAAFYRPTANIAVVDADTGLAQQLSRTAADVRWFRRLVIFHEFVHAWQFQRIPHLARILREHPIVGQAILEGQDEYCTRLYASLNGVVPLFRREIRFIRSLRASPQMGAAWVYFVFQRGYLFIRYLHTHAPRLRVQALFSGRLPTEKQIWFPDMYRRTGQAPVKPGRWPRATFATGRHLHHAVGVNFLGFRRYLAECGYTGSFGSRMLRAFVRGWRARNGRLDIACLAFTSAAMAKACAGVAELAERLRNGGKLKLGQAALGGVRCAYFAVHRGATGRCRAVLLARKGRVLLAVRREGFPGGGAELRGWSLRFLGNHLGDFGSGKRRN